MEIWSYDIHSHTSCCSKVLLFSALLSGLSYPLTSSFSLSSFSKRARSASSLRMCLSTWKALIIKKTFFLKANTKILNVRIWVTIAGILCTSSDWRFWVNCIHEVRLKYCLHTDTFNQNSCVTRALSETYITVHVHHDRGHGQKEAVIVYMGFSSLTANSKK